MAGRRWSRARRCFVGEPRSVAELRAERRKTGQQGGRAPRPNLSDVSIGVAHALVSLFVPRIYASVAVIPIAVPVMLSLFQHHAEIKPKTAGRLDFVQSKLSVTPVKEGAHRFNAAAMGPRLRGGDASNGKKPPWLSGFAGRRLHHTIAVSRCRVSPERNALKRPWQIPLRHRRSIGEKRIAPFRHRLRSRVDADRRAGAPGQCIDRDAGRGFFRVTHRPG